MMVLEPHQLATVRGGQNLFDDSSLGRCGPDWRMPWLGNVRTPACLDHDLLVRKALTDGSSRVGAQWKARGKLLAAVGSYLDVRFSGRNVGASQSAIA